VRALLDSAAHLARSALPVRARTLVRQAEERGFHRDVLGSARLLDQADDIISAERPEANSMYAALWSSNLHLAFRGKSAMLAGRPAEAIPFLELALRHERRDAAHNRSNMTADLGGAYAQHGHLDQAVSLLDQALTIAVAAGLKSCIERVKQIRDRELGRYALDALVQGLDERIQVAHGAGDGSATGQAAHQRQGRRRLR